MHAWDGHTKTPEYEAFCNAKNLCTNPKNPRYADYGGRGITFRFESFEQFLSELGQRPSPIYILGRIYTDGDYASGNVRWVTPGEQAIRKRLHPSGLAYKDGVPSVTIFVRHSVIDGKHCKYADDEFSRRCMSRAE